MRKFTNAAEWDGGIIADERESLRQCLSKAKPVKTQRKSFADFQGEDYKDCTFEELLQAGLSEVCGDSMHSQLEPVIEFIDDITMSDNLKKKGEKAMTKAYLLKRQKQIRLQASSLWKLYSTNNRLSSEQNEIGLSLGLSRTKSHVHDNLCAKGLTASRWKVRQLMVDLMTFLTAIVLPWVISKAVGVPAVILMDNLVLLGKYAAPAQGQGVVHSLKTVTTAICLLHSAARVAIVAKKAISPQYQEDLVLTVLEDDSSKPFNVDDDYTHDTSALPSTSNFFCLPQLFGNFTSFTFFPTVIQAFVKFETQFNLCPGDREPHWHFTKMCYFVHNQCKDRLAELNMTAAEINFIRKTIPTLATWHVQKYALESTVYFMLNLQNFTGEFLHAYGESKYGKYCTTERGELLRNNEVVLREMVTDLGLKDTCKDITGKTFSKCSKRDLVDVLIQFKHENDIPSPDDDVRVNLVDVSDLALAKARDSLQAVIDAEDFSMDNAARVLRETRQVAELSEDEEIIRRREQVNDLLEGNLRTDISAFTKGKDAEDPKDYKITYGRLASHMSLLWYVWQTTAKERVKKEVLDGKNGDDHTNPAIVFLWKLFEVDLWLCFEPFVNLQKGKPGIFLNALPKLASLLAYHGHPLIAQTVLIALSTFLYLQKHQPEIFKCILENCKTAFGDLIVELIGSNLSSCVGGSTCTNNEERTKKFTWLSPFKTLLAGSKQTSASGKRKPEMQRRLDAVKLEKFKETRAWIADFIVKKFKDTKEDKNAPANMRRMPILKEGREMAIKQAKHITEVLKQAAVTPAKGKTKRVKKADLIGGIQEMQGKLGRPVENEQTLDKQKVPALTEKLKKLKDQFKEAPRQRLQRPNVNSRYATTITQETPSASSWGEFNNEIDDQEVETIWDETQASLEFTQGYESRSGRKAKPPRNLQHR